MALTQQQLALQMLAQLRVLDPSISAEVGTPERKILDTVAQALSDAQVDLTQLSGALDIDAKSGTELDKFLALFGFGRQQATYASGFVRFSRDVASSLDIRIPARTQVMAPGIVIVNPPNDGIQNVIYETSFEVTLPANQLFVDAPITAVIAGSAGNTAVGAITEFAATAIYGITGITNQAPISGGVDSESDDQLKVRFKNTIFRNLAGTQDQFLALAASAKFTTKANVVGSISRYREYVQVPQVDDATSYDVNGDGITEVGNGSSGQYTTAISTVPYSKHIYDTLPNFISSGDIAGDFVFWREGIDWLLNTLITAKNQGDAFRLFSANPSEPDPLSPTNLYRPNVTMTNVYTGTNDEVTGIRPGDIVLFEHSYLSSASRNDITRQVLNCVDLYIDGSNDTAASMVIPAPGASVATQFVNNTASKYHYLNYRLDGEPDIAPATWTTTPAPGGSYVASRFLFIPAFFQPTTALPSSITVRDASTESMFFLNEHYWLVQDITELAGTVRARNGICWDKTLAGASGPTAPRTQPALQAYTTAGLAIEIENYLYDKNVPDLQAAIETARQVTTDVLVHKAITRYFKFDITVMYSEGANTTETNNAIYTALTGYLSSLYFGPIIQLSDILQVIHNVTGVDNVRWSQDLKGNTALHRVYGTNAGGVPRTNQFWDSDYILQDNELPALATDTSSADQTGVSQRLWRALPGLIIRTRAQNTFGRA